MKPKVIFLLAICFVINPAYALLKQQHTPGGVAVVKLLGNSSAPPRAYYNNKRVLVTKSKNNPGAWVAIVGIPLNARAGWDHIDVVPAHGNPYSRSFKINKKYYRVQRLKIKNKRKVNPSASDSRRIARERAIKKSIISHWDHDTTSPNDFRWPVTGRISASFGLRRIYNGQPRDPHSGVDIAAPSGKRVRVAANGTVIDTGNFFYTGNAIYVDHGQGLISMYCHLSKINVHRGQTLKRGQVIGLVGQTGRVTGPHLHWTMYMNQTLVDPLLFVSKPKNYRKSRSKSKS